MEGSNRAQNRPINVLRGFTSNHLPFSLPFNLFSNGYLSQFDLGDDFYDGSVLGRSSCYSSPLVFVDMVWNLGFVFVCVFLLLVSLDEQPLTPLRFWVFGYGFQCFLHVGFVWFEYCRRFHCELGYGRTVKRLETANTIASSFWWVFGFYWIVTGGQALMHDSPRLYWLTVVLLTLDVVFMVFCIGLACIVFLGLFCVIPIVAIAYAMAVREGASDDEIKLLPKFKFHQSNGSMKSTNENAPPHHAEDSECCICLNRYKEGAELCGLPCNHHFHSGCITRWLRINSTCPLCKFNIKSKGEALV